jgi:hypothetical protein
MSTDETHATDTTADKHAISVDRHSPQFRIEFQRLADEFHGKCPIAWNDTHGGYWFASGYQEVFDLARRADVLSNDHDISGTRRGYLGINIPPDPRGRRSRAASLRWTPLSSGTTGRR